MDDVRAVSKQRWERLTSAKEKVGVWRIVDSWKRMRASKNCRSKMTIFEWEGTGYFNKLAQTHRKVRCGFDFSFPVASDK